MFPKTFTPEELTEWLNTLDMPTSIAILEKLYKDMRDYALSLHDTHIQKSQEIK